MEEAHDEELRILRARAYGPGADIHADPRALARLRELEAAGRNSNSGDNTHVPDLVINSVPVEPPEVIEPEVDRRELLGPGLARGVRFARSVAATFGAVRRSTWLIVVGVAVIAGVLATALVLVQRVQTDPLQIGATQVARLSVDPDYEIPNFFATPASDEPRVQAFEEFHGLRTVLNGFFRAGSADDCILIYAPTEIAVTVGGIAGQFVTGCAAAEFPAMVQFRADLEGFPPTLHQAFPDSTAFQFVYDRENDEVVVFASGGK